MHAGVLKVPIAAIKALAVLTSSPIVRGRLNGVSEALPAVLALLQLPYATTDVRSCMTVGPRCSEHGTLS